MNPEQKNPGIGFWFTVLFVVAVAIYPVSFGPACWISSRTGYGDSFITSFYQPIFRIGFERPETAGQSIVWYAGLLSPPGWDVTPTENGKYCWAPPPSGVAFICGFALDGSAIEIEEQQEPVSDAGFLFDKSHPHQPSIDLLPFSGPSY